MIAGIFDLPAMNREKLEIPKMIAGIFDLPAMSIKSIIYYTSTSVGVFYIDETVNLI
ncbi:hypothetical protein OCL94_08005 [Macrococcus sp. TMW 2.2395]|nr:hypothetical protein [Macrococcus sp. TMW 2.2395]